MVATVPAQPALIQHRCRQAVYQSLVLRIIYQSSWLSRCLFACGEYLHGRRPLISSVPELKPLWDINRLRSQCSTSSIVAFDKHKQYRRRKRLWLRVVWRWLNRGQPDRAHQDKLRFQQSNRYKRWRRSIPNSWRAESSVDWVSNQGNIMLII